MRGLYLRARTYRKVLRLDISMGSWSEHGVADSCDGVADKLWSTNCWLIWFTNEFVVDSGDIGRLDIERNWIRWYLKGTYPKEVDSDGNIVGYGN